MFTNAWRGQVRRVQILNGKVDDWTCQEQVIRNECKVRCVDLFTRLETLVVIGATGTVWASRLKKDKDDARSRPLVALAGAAFLVNRWRRFARHFTIRVRQGRWIRDHRSDRRQTLSAKNADALPASDARTGERYPGTGE